MEKNELIAKVNEVLAEEFEKDVDNISSDAKIIKTLELDSLTLVDMAALIDKEFGVKISNAELKKIRTFADLYNYLIENGALEK